MALKPNKRIATWATGGGAPISDPGPAKQDAGWLVDEAPTANNFNWILNSTGDWLAFLRSVLGVAGIFPGLTYNATQPWGAVHNTFRCQYLPLLGKWFAADHATSSNAWDSTDGITWSGSTQLEAASTSVSPLAEDSSGNVFVSSDEKVFKTTTGAAAGLVQVGSFNNIIDAKGLVWDEAEGYLIATGGDGASGRIETSPDGVTWTSRAISGAGGAALSGVAIDPVTGNLVAANAIISSVWTSADGITWVENATPASAGQSINAVYWNSSLGRFVGATNTKTLAFSIDGTGSWQEFAAPFTDVEVLINTPDGLLVFLDDANATDPGGVYLFSKGRIDTGTITNSSYNLQRLGEVQGLDNLAGDFITGLHLEGGDGTIVFPWGSYKLAYSNY